MSTPALICDTGAILDYLVETAPDHRAFRDAIDRSRTRYLPGLVLAEVDYFLRKEREAMSALIRDLSRGAFTYAAPTLAILERAMDIDRRSPLRRPRPGGCLGRHAGGRAGRAPPGNPRRAPLQRGQAAGGKRFELVVQPRRPDRGGG